MDIRIRHAIPEDRDALVAGNLGLARESEGIELDVERLRRGVREVLSDSRRGRYWVAESGGRVIAQLMICTEWSDWRDGEFWWIESVYVDPEFRRRGVYRSLYEHVLGVAHDSGDVCGIRLYVENHNEAAMATYSSLGMQPSHYQMFELDFAVDRVDEPSGEGP